MQVSEVPDYRILIAEIPQADPRWTAQREIVVSPNRFGAGVVNFTAANLSDSPVTFTHSGPNVDMSRRLLAPPFFHQIDSLAF